MPSGRAEDEVDAAVGADNVGQLADLEPERRVLERLLHLTSGEEAQVSRCRVRRAVGQGQG